jgi:hypothetical protein
MEGTGLVLHDEGEGGFGGHVSVGLEDWVTGDEPVAGDIIGCVVLPEDCQVVECCCPFSCQCRAILLQERRGG